MKPIHKKEQYEKTVRQLKKRQREIWLKTRELGYKKLDKPIRHGWFYEIYLSSRIKEHKQQKEIEVLFDSVKTSFWGDTKEKALQAWKKENATYLLIKDFPTISKKQYSKIPYKAQLLCHPFRYKTENNKRKTRFYINIPKECYRFYYTKAYITHRKIIDPELEREMDLLEQKIILKNGLYKASNIGCNPSLKKIWGIDTNKKEKLASKKWIRSIQKYGLIDQ